MNKHHLLSLGCAALMLASCTDDALDNGASNGHGPEADSNVVTMTVLDGASQQGRIYSVPSPDTRALKSQRLQYVATIDNEILQAKDKVWSATSVYLDDETKQVYVTWHSDKQAHNEAQAWGGALDIINIADEDKPEMVQTAASKDLLKFNHVMKYGDKLFLSGNHPTKGGVVARIALNNLSKAEVIGFPGSSVNAVAEYTDGNLIAVSGFKGTYGTFEPDVKKQDYDYLLPDNNKYLKLFEEEVDDDFGGKYVVKGDDGNIYLLRQNGRGANDKGQIIDVANEKTINMSVSLLSENKWAEDYDPETGDWKVEESSGQSVYYGKHVMVVRDGYAYVAAGQNGLYKYNLTSGEETRINKVFTTGLYADDEFLYTAGGSGLRIYQFQEDGTLPLYAFEVETYNEQTGAPTSKDAATTGYQTNFRHSPNFVAAHYNADKKNTYIYIAYGQSGVRVYKFAKDGEEQPGDEDDHPYVDPGEDSPIVWATEDIEGYYAWGEIFHAASGDNTLYTFEADPEGLSFTAPDGTVVTNDATYWPADNGSSYKNAYTLDNYRYFDGKTSKYTKYTINQETMEPDGKTILDPEDDVAVMRWGNGWRMPTSEEFQTMINSAVNRELNEESREFVLTFENGAVLIFPPTGYYDRRGEWYSGDDVWESGFHYYWSSSLSTIKHRVSGDHPNDTGGYIETIQTETIDEWCYESLAMLADFGYGGQPENDHMRTNGFKVRAVKAKKDMPEKFPEWQNK